MSKNQVAKKASNEVANADAAAQLAKLLGKQEQNADANSYAIPFLKVLQSNSPQCDPQNAAYDEDAKQGMIVSTVSGELFAELEVAEAAFVPEYIEWKPNRGGMVGRLRCDDPRVLNRVETEIEGKRKELCASTQNELVDTRQHYVLYKNKNGLWKPAIMPLSSTQLKVSRTWRMQQADDAEAGEKWIYKLTTAGKSNDKGSWFIFVVKRERALDLNEDADLSLVSGLVEFSDSIERGAVTMDESQFGEGKAGANAASDDFTPF